MLGRVPDFQNYILSTEVNLELTASVKCVTATYHNRIILVPNDSQRFVFVSFCLCYQLIQSNSRGSYFQSKGRSNQKSYEFIEGEEEYSLMLCVWGINPIWTGHLRKLCCGKDGAVSAFSDNQNKLRPPHIMCSVTLLLIRVRWVDEGFLENYSYMLFAAAFFCDLHFS